MRGWSRRQAGPFREEDPLSLSEPANPSETSLARRHQRPSRPAGQAPRAVKKTPESLAEDVKGLEGMVLVPLVLTD